jgi:hypothetical protein
MGPYDNPGPKTESSIERVCPCGGAVAVGGIVGYGGVNENGDNNGTIPPLVGDLLVFLSTLVSDAVTFFRLLEGDPSLLVSNGGIAGNSLFCCLREGRPLLIF